MRAIAWVVVVLGMTVSVGAQEIRNVRIDFGYGMAPAFNNPYDGYRGIHANVAAETPWGDLEFHYLSRKPPTMNYAWYAEQSTSTIALQVGQSWRSSRAQFTISGGLGIFNAKITQPVYNWTAFTTSSSTETFTRVAFPVGTRICWNVSDHFGIGAAVFGAYVTDYSYVGFHGFVRVRL